MVGPTRKSGFFAEILRNRVSYAMVVPALLFEIVFGYLTLPYLVTAFQKFSFRTTIFTAQWYGIKNFEFFFRSRAAGEVTWNTLHLNVMFIAFTTLTALALALVLSEVRWKKAVKVAQSTYLFPHFISWIIASYIVYGFFATKFGVINGALASVGAEPRNWYTDPGPWPAILTTLRVWKGAGMQTVIFLAAITAIDPQLYEAAVIDGAGRVSAMFRITIPLVLPTVSILTLLAVGRMFYGDFAMIYAIVGDNGLLYPTVDVIDTYVFRALRTTGNPSQAMAVGLYQSFVGFALVWGSNRIVRRFSSEGALF
jgi:putative aldouronate transport system permease protein